jgi:hypothetical protein
MDLERKLFKQSKLPSENLYSKKDGLKPTFFSSSHNSSSSTYGFSPEELHVGFRNPKTADLVQFWSNTKSPEQYAKKEFQNRSKSQKHGSAESGKTKCNCTSSEKQKQNQ